MSRAAASELDALHALAARTLADELKRASAAAREPRTIRSPDGKAKIPNPAYQALNPQLIDKVLKFLKDNGIDSPARGSAVSNLAEALRDLDVGDMASFQ
ncbi:MULTISPECIES: hypothetical protein [unclassified Sphingomonas]|uniref:hypothetical protein n=1 Tax=unclassified Sphingomonas TaxID=196159 RepID=UPI002151CF9E|nr:MULTISPECIES: hypothetical protein [unclassified Sphingomonas]MCR5870669.1 hypothetical protein [Sphingomonas sp. J344]UUY00995.1 hypothetical protein LRS08_08045 [Sphingomonas sp. J315]